MGTLGRETKFLAGGKLGVTLCANLLPSKAVHYRLPPFQPPLPGPFFQRKMEAWEVHMHAGSLWCWSQGSDFEEMGQAGPMPSGQTPPSQS